MSEIEGIADTEFNKLHVDLGELNSELNVDEGSTDGQDMLEELLGVVSAFALSTSGMALCDGRHVFGIDSCRGPLLLYCIPSLLAFIHALAFTYTATLVTKGDQTFIWVRRFNGHIQY